MTFWQDTWDLSYQERKALRTAEYKRNHGRKLVKCGCCNGSSYYDNTGSPPCGWCEGTGKEREPLKPENA